jgi:hypothetical protein
MYAVKFEDSRPAGNFRDVITLRRKWAVVRMAKPFGYAVVSRFSTKEAAEQAAAKLRAA